MGEIECKPPTQVIIEATIISTSPDKSHSLSINNVTEPSSSSILIRLHAGYFRISLSLGSQAMLWKILTESNGVFVKMSGMYSASSHLQCWFTIEKRFLSIMENPTSQISVVGNLVAARAAAQIGWKESAVCMWSLGMVHYLVLFVTFYQRLSCGNCLPLILRPTFFLFFAAPSMASLAWNSITGAFDTTSKMLFFFSLFLFMSLVNFTFIVHSFTANNVKMDLKVSSCS
ncbi:hypothetical protein CRYUN_Cryun37aG0126900 [Craigia yunnanensis]